MRSIIKERWCFEVASKIIEEKIQKLLTDEVPDSVKRMILDLSDSGKNAIVGWYEENSNFHSHADLVINAHKFGVDTFKDRQIFHYTTVSSLEKILSSRQFRIKSSRFMNDPDEFQWASKLARKILIENNADSDEIKEFDKAIDKQPIQNSYVWSFTENNDSETLYAAYGNKEGVALELNLPSVMKVLATHNTHGKESLEDLSDEDAYTFPLRVEYDAQVQIDYVKPVVLEWLNALRAYQEDKSDMEHIMIHCSKNIALFNMAFKNPLLNHEEELRFVVLSRSAGPELLVDGIPFVQCDISSKFIKSVQLQNDCKYSSEYVTRFMHSDGYSIPVVNSKLPY